jgi:hypothetical protein
VFEGKDKADRATIAVEKEIFENAHIEHAGDVNVVHVDDGPVTKSALEKGIKSPV